MRALPPIFLMGILSFSHGNSDSQEFPNKPIRVFTAGAGGGADFISRLIAQEISGPMGHPVVVENRPGVISAETVAKAPPDGHTLLVYGTPFWIGPLLQKLSYDPVRDFAPVTLAGITPNIAVVHSSLPVKSIRELITLAKARPREINYASNEVGASNHLAGELFNTMAGVSIVRVPYKGTATALTATLGGEVQLTFTNANSVMPHVKRGRLRALAVTSADPSPLVPGLPTVAATVPGYESVLIVGIFAPAKTPAAPVERLNREISRVLDAAKVKETFFNAGIQVGGSSPGQLSVTVRSDMARMGKVIKDANIHAE